jgi:hypothetical protein
MVEYTPPSSGGGGLTSVATDSTLTGDGTVGDPLSVDVKNVYSVMTAQYPSTGIMFTSPFVSYPMMAGGYVEEISSPDFDITASAIRPFFDGQMKITVQFTLMALTPKNNSSVTLTGGLCDALLPTPIGIMQQSEVLNIAPSFPATAMQTVEFSYVIDCVANTLYHPYIVAEGDAIDFELMGDEGRTTIIAERVA